MNMAAVAPHIHVESPPNFQQVFKVLGVPLLFLLLHLDPELLLQVCDGLRFFLMAHPCEVGFCRQILVGLQSLLQFELEFVVPVCLFVQKGLKLRDLLLLASHH